MSPPWRSSWPSVRSTTGLSDREKPSAPAPVPARAARGHHTHRFLYAVPLHLRGQCADPVARERGTAARNRRRRKDEPMIEILAAGYLSMKAHDRWISPKDELPVWTGNCTERSSR